MAEQLAPAGPIETADSTPASPEPSTCVNSLRMHTRVHELAESFAVNGAVSKQEGEPTGPDAEDAGLPTIEESHAWADLVAAHASLLPLLDESGLTHRCVDYLDESAQHLATHSQRLTSVVVDILQTAAGIGTGTSVSPEVAIAIEANLGSMLVAKAIGSLSLDLSCPSYRGTLDSEWVSAKASHSYFSKHAFTESDSCMRSPLDGTFSHSLISYAIARAAVDGAIVELQVDTSTGRPYVLIEMAKEVEEDDGDSGYFPSDFEPTNVAPSHHLSHTPSVDVGFITDVIKFNGSHSASSGKFTSGGANGSASATSTTTKNGLTVPTSGPAGQSVSVGSYDEWEEPDAVGGVSRSARITFSKDGAETGYLDIKTQAPGLKDHYYIPMIVTRTGVRGQGLAEQNLRFGIGAVRSSWGDKAVLAHASNPKVVGSLTRIGFKPDTRYELDSQKLGNYILPAGKMLSKSEVPTDHSSDTLRLGGIVDVDAYNESRGLPPALLGDYIDRDGYYVVVVKYNKMHDSGGQFGASLYASSEVAPLEGGKGKWRGADAIEQESNDAHVKAQELMDAAKSESDPNKAAKLQARSKKWSEHGDALAGKADRARVREGGLPKPKPAAPAEKPAAKPPTKPHEEPKKLDVDEVDPFPSNDPAHDTPKMAECRKEADILEMQHIAASNENQLVQLPNTFNKKYVPAGESGMLEPSARDRADALKGDKHRQEELKRWEARSATPEGKLYAADKASYPDRKKASTEKVNAIEQAAARNDYAFMNEKYGPVVDAGKVKLVSVEEAMNHPNINPARKAEYLSQKSANDISSKAWADELGVPHERLQMLRQAQMDDEIHSSTLAMRVNQSNFAGVISSGKVKNQFEVAHSNGYFDKQGDSHKMRKDAEGAMFGTPRDLPGAQRPVYGYLSNSKFGEKYGSSDTLDQYGDVVIHLKGSTKTNSTFSMTDSLDSGGNALAFRTDRAPAWASGMGSPHRVPYLPNSNGKGGLNPSYSYGSPFGRRKTREIEVGPDGKQVGEAMHDYMAKTPKWMPKPVIVEPHYSDQHWSPMKHNTLTGGNQYNEVQVHGGLFSTSFKSVTFVGPIDPNPVHVAKLQKKGITTGRDSQHHVSFVSDKKKTWFVAGTERVKKAGGTLKHPVWSVVLDPYNYLGATS